MLKRKTALAGLTAGLLLAAGATGCGSTQASSAPGQTPVTSGVITPGTTRPHPGPTDAPAAPGTAVLLQDRSASYTPAGATHPSPYQPIDPAAARLTVARGTRVELRLPPATYLAPRSSNPEALQKTATWDFLAAAPGTSVLSAMARPCSGVEAACTSPYQVTIIITA